MQYRKLSIALAGFVLATASIAASAADYVFSNTAPIAIQDTAAASPYPSTIMVSGLAGNVDNVRITLHGLQHTFPRDIDLMIVSPTGQQVMLMSDVGGNADVTGLTLTFSGSASAAIPNGGPLNSGTYLPSDNDNLADTAADTNFPAPAPADASTTNLASFNSSAAAANGTWSLYAIDDLSGDTGAITSGWSITFAQAQTCATEGYTYTQLEWCKNICERGYTGNTLNMWIRRWTERYRTLPYCAVAPPPPPQEG